MRERFWMELYDLKFTIEFYKIYQLSSSFWNRIISIICFVGSGGGIAAWYGLQKYTTLWAIITGAFTVLQFACPFLKFSDRIAPLQFAVQDLQHLFNQMQQTWDMIDKIDECESQRRFSDYSDQQLSIEMKYLSDLEIKQIARFQKRAQKYTESYFAYYYDVHSSNYERNLQ